MCDLKENNFLLLRLKKVLHAKGVNIRRREFENDELIVCAKLS